MPSWNTWGVPSRLSEYAGWYCRVYVRVHLLRRESSTRGWVGQLSTHWVGGEGDGFKKLWEVGNLVSTRPYHRFFTPTTDDQCICPAEREQVPKNDQPTMCATETARTCRSVVVIAG